MATDSGAEPLASRTRLRLVLYPLATVVVCAGLLLLALHFPPVQQYAFRLLSSRLNAANATVLDVSQIRFNIFAGTLEARGLVVRAAGSEGLPPVAVAESLAIRYHPHRLLLGLRGVEQISLERPAIRVVVTKDGRSNLPKFGSGGKFDWNSLPGLRIENASAQWEDDSRGVRVFLPRLRLLASRGQTGSQVSLSGLQSGSVEIQGRTVPVSSFAFLGSLGSDSLQVDSLKIEGSGIQSRFRGTVSALSSPRLDIDSATSVDLAALFKSLKLQSTLKGQVNSTIHWSGGFTSLTGEGDVGMSGVRWRAFDGLSGSARLKWLVGSSVFEIARFGVRSPDGSLSGRGLIDVSAQGTSELRAEVSNVNGGSLTKALGWEPRISSQASGTVSMSWKGTAWKHLKIVADLALTPLGGARQAGAAALGGNVGIDWEEGDLKLAFNPVSGAGFDVRGSFNYGRSGSLDGQLEADVYEVQNLLEGLGDAWPDSVGAIDLPVNGSLELSGTLSGRWGDPRVLARFARTRLSSGVMQGLNLSGEAEYASRRVTLRSMSLGWQDQLARVSGDLDFTAPGPAVLDLKGEIGGASVASILSGFGWEQPVTGMIQADAVVRGTVTRPDIEASLRIDELEFWQERFGTLTASGRLVDRRIVANPIRLDKTDQGGGGIIEATGSLDLDTDQLAFNATGRGLRLESMSTPGGIPVRGDVDVTVTAGGNIPAPEWSILLDGERVSLGRLDVGPVRADLAGAGPLAILSAEASAFPIILRGSIGSAPPFEFHLDLDGRHVDVSRFQIPVGEEGNLEGSFNLRATAEGTLSELRDVSGTATLDDLELRFADQEIRSRGAVQAAWHDRTLRLEPSTLSSEGSVLNVEGLLPFDRQAGEGAILLNGSVSLPLVTRLLPGGRGLASSGTVTLKGAVRGSFGNLEPLLEATADKGELQLPGLRKPLTIVAADVQFDPHAAVVRRLEASLGGGSLRLTGQLPWRTLSEDSREAPLAANLTLVHVDPGVMDFTPPFITGSLDASLKIEGPRADLGSLRGQARIDTLKLQAGDTTIEQSAATELELEGGLLRLKSFGLRGPNTQLEASGWARLTGDRRVDARVSGSSDARFLGGAGGGLWLSGPVELKVEVGGTIDDPSFQGSADLTDGRFQLATPPMAGEGLAGHAELSGRRITVTRLAGEVNGGELSAEGGFSLTRDGLSDLLVNLSARNVFLDYPLKLRTGSNVEGVIRSDGDMYLVEGQVLVLQGEQRDAINLQALQTVQIQASEGNTLADHFRFNVQIRTEAPLHIDNNLGRIDAYANLRLVGTASRPALLGRLELDEDGRIYFAERSFTIQNGVINFTNEQAIEPYVNLTAETRVSDYAITIQATGGLRDLETSFTSDPPASQDQILSLIFTGSVNNADKVSTGQLGSRGALSLFGSAMIGGFNAAVRRTLGFSEFRIEPTLISPDTDPSARLTIGQNITPELRLTYSTNLRNANDRIWIAEYDWRRKIVGRYVDQSEDSNRGELLHRLRFGGGPGTGDMRSTRHAKSEILESYEIVGDTGFPPEEIPKRLDLKNGSPFRYLDLQEKLEKLKDRYAKEGYLEARIRQSRRTEAGRVRLTLNFDVGRLLTFRFEGYDVDKATRREIKKAWRSGIVERQRLDATLTIVRRALYEDRYCDAEVEAQIGEVEGKTTPVVFTITPGLRYSHVVIRFDRFADGLSEDVIGFLRKERLDSEVARHGDTVRRAVLSELQERGYLTAEVDPPKIERRPEEKIFETVFPVRSGPRYRVGKIRVEGDPGIPQSSVDKSLQVRTGDWFVPSRQVELTDALVSLNRRSGYREATVDLRMAANPRTGTVDLTFLVRQNQRSVVASIRTSGFDQTNDTFLRRRIPLSVGDAVDSDKLAEVRRRILNSGSYNMADIMVEQSKEKAATEDTQPVDLVVQVREPKPYSFVYGAIYDSVSGAGLSADLSMRNKIGAGRVLGYRVISDLSRRNQRVYFSQPFLGRHNITSTIDLSREDKVIDNLDTLQENVTFQQLVEYQRRFTLSYGYRFRRSQSRLIDTQGDVVQKGSSSPLFVALSRDTRDDVFDATVGSYASQAFEYGPKWLGGSDPYYRYFGQYFKYFGLTRPALVPTTDLRKPRFVFATGIRAGVMGSVGSNDPVLVSERFFAGGGSTVRGFVQNSLGPTLDDGQPIGGQAILLLNNELRTPFYRFFDAATFVDVGNVWARPSDFRFNDLRTSAGFGIRVRTPFVILRFDYGWKLDRRPGESRGAFHFSIGQAF
jgi:outer membrane protein assembly complex protein YaeT